MEKGQGQVALIDKKNLSAQTTGYGKVSKA